MIHTMKYMNVVIGNISTVGTLSDQSTGTQVLYNPIYNSFIYLQTNLVSAQFGLGTNQHIRKMDTKAAELPDSI